MRLTAFEHHIKRLLPARDAEDQPRCLSLSDLCRQVGIARETLYRRFASLPWERTRRRWSEGEVFTRLATILQDAKDHLLWLAGYNPFVARGLSERELDLLWEINAKIVHAVKEGIFDGDLRRLAALASKELAAKSKARKAGKECAFS